MPQRQRAGFGKGRCRARAHTAAATVEEGQHLEFEFERPRVTWSRMGLKVLVLVPVGTGTRCIGSQRPSFSHKGGRCVCVCVLVVVLVLVVGDSSGMQSKRGALLVLNCRALKELTGACIKEAEAHSHRGGHLHAVPTRNSRLAPA